MLKTFQIMLELLINFNIRNWEDFALTRPNCLIQLGINLLLIEIKYLGAVDLCLNFERK
jgi:hypothetical protein